MKYLLIGLIKLYRLTLSKIKPPCCRFYPTCSVYGINAIRRYGSVKGGCLTVRRIVRCNPWNAGGYDPVPEEFSFFRRRETAGEQERTVIKEK
jgi:hypothetical protein